MLLVYIVCADFAISAIVILKISKDVMLSVWYKRLTKVLQLCFISFFFLHSLTAASGAVCKTLVVNNLAFSATEEVLQSTFEKAVSIRIPQRDGRPKG